MSKVRGLKGQTIKSLTVAEFLESLKEDSGKYDKAIVILIEDRAGNWSTCWSVLNMANVEVNFALDLTKRQLLETLAKDP